MSDVTPQQDLVEKVAQIISDFEGWDTNSPFNPHDHSDDPWEKEIEEGCYHATKEIIPIVQEALLREMLGGEWDYEIRTFAKSKGLEIGE